MKQKLEILHQKYQQFYNIAFFILGFFFDIFTLGRIDDLSNLYILLLYIIVAKIFLIEIYLKKNIIPYPKKITQYVLEYRTEAFHFCLGALLSAMTIFFFKSSSNMISHVLLGVIIFLLLINESSYLKSSSTRFKIILMLMAVNSFFVVFFPVLMASLNPFIFIGTQILFIIYSFLTFHFLRKSDYEDSTLVKHWIKPSLIITLTMSAFYFTKSLPPVPLHLQKIGIYHQVKKEYPKYRLSYKRRPYFIWKDSSNPFYAKEGDILFVFTRVFAPKGFKQKIYLHWEVEKGGDWMESDKIPLNLLGGREDGFRGYGLKKNFVPGNWRIYVKTESGLEIGKISFSILPIGEHKLISKEEIDL
ncbi:DUF2914 domain-containing protein [Bacteriovoracaceae bacterium]|nr:DUF2914 domain-containing protein [Bacteriovoracaceae bacterium]